MNQTVSDTERYSLIDEATDEVNGVDPKELAEAAKKLLILEIVAMESKLSMRDALELGEKVTRKAWEKLKRGES